MYYDDIDMATSGLVSNKATLLMKANEKGLPSRRMLAFA